ncbi:MAG: ribonuclease, partial [Pseudomonadota bacterium]
ALRHRSAGKPNNERLEFLGDAILGLLVSDALYRKFPKASEGELTQARSHLVREPTLAEIARERDLGAQLELGPGELKSGGHRRDSILADAVEAVIAAVYLDAGFVAAQSLVDDWFGARLQLSLEKSPGKDPKTKLQEWLQSKQHALPVYRLLQAGGSDHARNFDVECILENLAIITAGSGSSVKSAEADAARKALILLGQNK